MFAFSVLLDWLLKGFSPTLIVFALCLAGGICYRFYSGDAKYGDIAWGLLLVQVFQQ
jgi:hypothetical protein